MQGGATSSTSCGLSNWMQGGLGHARANDSLDVGAAFIAGRGALALIALIQDVFQGGVPPRQCALGS